MSFSHIVFLGTSSGVRRVIEAFRLMTPEVSTAFLQQIPTAERNVSGYTLTLSDGSHWLIDCGEGQEALAKLH